MLESLDIRDNCKLYNLETNLIITPSKDIERALKVEGTYIFLNILSYTVISAANNQP